jgi:hypothetical protein
MAISPGQAAAALEDIAQTEQRTRVAGGYAVASPYLILWGLVWTAGYVGCALLPSEQWGLVWLPGVLVGAVGSGMFGQRTRRTGRGTQGGSFGQAAVMAVTIALFFGSVFYVFRPSDLLPYLVFPALVVGLVYTLAGTLAHLPRFAAIGAAIFVATMAGYFAAPQFMAWWIALVAGGGLILGGLWLRKI